MQSTLRDHLAGSNHLNTLVNSIPGKIILAIAATGLMAMAAHISIPLPFSPVPLALTPFAVLMIGMTLGPITAFSAMILYLAEGAIGMPVFTPQGPGGIAQLLGPTGGYLLAYPFAAAAAGWIARSFSFLPSSLLRNLLAGTVATTIILTLGAVWIATLLHLNIGATWQLAVAPFLPGGVVMIAAAAVLFCGMHRRHQS
jgi:biotin transport system substrate-specific component